MRVSVHSKVEKGRLSRNRQSLARAIEQFEGKEITISIERKKKQRSNQQNAYYWGVIIPLISQGLTALQGEPVGKQETHEMLKCKFLSEDILNGNTGEITSLPKSSTGLSTGECEEYYENCRNWAAEWLNIEIPLPNEQMTIET